MVNIKYRDLWRLMIYVSAFTCQSLAISGQTVLNDSHTVGLTLPEIALFDIEPAGGNIILSMAVPTEAGDPVNAPPALDNSLWINYSSAVPPNSSRSVTAQITAGNVPPGVVIQLIAANYSGTGSGVFGIPSAQLILDNTPQQCIGGIGGCYTGNGSGNGHQLTYTLDISNYGNLEAGLTANIQITYTLTDN